MVDWKKFWETNRNGLLVTHVDEVFSYTKTGYRFHRRMIKIGLFSCLGILLAVLLYGFFGGIHLHELYFSCPENATGGCRNPFYERCTESFCQAYIFQETFPAGTKIGTPPDKAFVFLEFWSGVVSIVVLVIFLLVNHFLYNKGKTPIEFSDEK